MNEKKIKMRCLILGLFICTCFSTLVQAEGELSPVIICNPSAKYCEFIEDITLKGPKKEPKAVTIDDETWTFSSRFIFRIEKGTKIVWGDKGKEE